MILHDISRDTLRCAVYEGDPETEVRTLQTLEEDGCNLSAVSMSVHAGTHIDAPLHFWEDGSPVDELRLNTFYGKCTVISVEGILTGDDMERLLPYCKRRVPSWHAQALRCWKISISRRLTTANMSCAPFPSSWEVWRQRPAAQFSLKWKRG